MVRPKREKTSITLPINDVQVIASRLGFKNPQDFLDDLAMGLIPPTADLVASPVKLPAVEGSGRSAEVAQPEPEGNQTKYLAENFAPSSSNRLSWADQTELEGRND